MIGDKTGAVQRALARKYAAPSYALFFEVPDATGMAKSRTADAIAMGLWPSRGLHLHGFEIKAYRSDWLGELKKPQKAESISAYCDYWWVVAADKDVVLDISEVPGTWGLMELKGGRLHTRKEAPERQPLPVDRRFLASLLRERHKSLLENDEVRTAIEAVRKEERQRAEEKLKFDVIRAKRELEYCREGLDAFEKASGLKIDDFDGGWLGDAVKFLRHLGTYKLDLGKLTASLENIRETHAREEKNVAEALVAIHKAVDALPAQFKKPR